MLNRIALRYLVPLGLFVASFLVIVFFNFVSIPQVREEATKLGMTQLNSLLQINQAQVNALMNEGATSGIKRNIFIISADPSIKAYLLIDEAGIIRYAHRSLLVGQRYDAAGYILDAAVMRDVARNGTLFVAKPDADSTNLVAYGGIAFDEDNKARFWTLVMVQDYSALRTAMIEISGFSAEVLATLMVAAGFIGIILLNGHVNRRIAPILAAANRVAAGETGVRAGLGGADEFSDIGRAFDLMAADIDRNRKDLLNAKEAAVVANKVKTNFLSLVSQEIQTPLTGLLGFMDLLKETRLDTDARLYIRSAESATRTLSGLLDDLLETTRLETGAVTVIERVFCVNSLVQDILDTALPSALAKKLSLLVRYSDDDPLWVTSDPHIFRQILMNLVGNAVHFTRQGSVTIEILPRELPDDRIDLSIRVIDTGPGIEPEVQKAMLGLANDQGTLARRADSGPNLTLCRQFAEMIGGSLTVESAPSMGATFTFRSTVLRAAPDEEDAMDLVPRREQVPAHILVHAKDAVTGKLMESIFTKWGHKVESVPSGQAVLDLFRQRLIYPQSKPIDLLVIDIGLPDTDGVSLLRDLRGLDSSLAELPVMALVVRNRADLRDDCIRAGFNSVIAKPIDQRHLAEEVFRLTYKP